MPMPTARTGSARLPPDDFFNTKSTTINTAPIAIPVKMYAHSRLWAKIPDAIVVIKVACGAAKACAASMPSRGIAPVKP